MHPEDRRALLRHAGVGKKFVPYQLSRSRRRPMLRADTGRVTTAFSAFLPASFCRRRRFRKRAHGRQISLRNGTQAKIRAMMVMVQTRAVKLSDMGISSFKPGILRIFSDPHGGHFEEEAGRAACPVNQGQVIGCA